MQNTSHYRLVAVVLFGIVLIVATFFRVYNLQSAPPGLYPDEAMNGSNALEAIATGNYKLFYPENNGREGLFINIQAQFLKLFNVNEPWVLRSASAVFGTLTVLGLFFLILQLYRTIKGFGLLEDKRPLTGLIAAFSGSFLMATSFWHINFSRIGFRAIMAPFFIVWSTYFLLKGFEKGDQPITNNEKLITKKSSIMGHKLLVGGLLLLSGVVFGLGMHSYIAYRALPIFILLVFALYGVLFSVSFKKMFFRFVLFVVGALISTASLINFFVHNPQDFFGRTAQISIFSSDNPLMILAVNVGKTFLSFFWFGDYNWRHNYAGMGELYPLVSILFLIGVVLGIVYLKGSLTSVWRSRTSAILYKGETFIFLFAGALFVAALLPTIVSSEGIPHALRAIIMIPAVFIFVGVGAAHAYEWIRKSNFGLGKLGFGIIFVCVFFLLPAAHTYYLYFSDWADKKEVKNAFSQDYVDVGRQVNALGVSIPKYVVVNESSVDVRGIPVRAQTTMFITDTFTPEKQKEKNIYYVLSKDADAIPQGVPVFYIR